MSAKVEEFKKRCEARNVDDEYWLKLEADLKEFWKTATQEEKDEWIKDWGYGEMLCMICSGIRYEREKEKKHGKG